MSVKIITVENDEGAIQERILIAYDPRNNIYFYRPFYGIENNMTTSEVSNRIRARSRKWRVSREILLELALLANQSRDKSNQKYNDVSR